MESGVPNGRRVAVAVFVFVVFLWTGSAVATAATAPGSSVAPDVVEPSNESTGEWDGTDSETLSQSTVSGAIRVTYRVDRTPADLSTVRVNYTAVIPENVDRLNVSLASLSVPYSVESTDGMQFDAADGVARATSPVGSETTVGLTYTIDSNVTAPSGSGFDSVETPEWAFLGRTQLQASHNWRYYDSPVGLEASHQVDGDGVAAEGIAYLGPARTARQTTGDQSFLLVVPEAADPAVDSRSVLDSLDNASGALRVGDRDPDVTAFVAPDPIRRGGIATGGATFWAHESSDFAAGSTWFHEYVHTRQAWTDRDFRLRAGADVEWFTEASADYYGGLLAWRNGTADAADFRAFVDTDRYADEVLQDANTVSTERKNYNKGRRVLAALDVRIRQQTDGNRTLEDVVRQINGLSGSEFGYADLREEVVATTNASTGTWLDRYVTTSAAPTIPADIEVAYDASPDPTLSASLSPASVTADRATTVTVTVTDQAGAAVDGATVAIPSLNASGSTAADGTVTLPVNASAGDYDVSVTADGYAGGTATLTVQPEAGSGPEIIAGTPSADTDGDGLLDDLNGNGVVDRGDAQALFTALGSPVVEDNADLLDYNGNGAVDRGDVQSVFSKALQA